MNRISINGLAALAATVTLAFPAASSRADPQDDDSGLSEPMGIMSPTTPSVDSVDGTGLRSVTDPAIDSVDGTGLRSVSDPAIDSVDGTGLRSVSDPTIDSVDGTGLRSVAADGTDSVDGTGSLRSVADTDLAASGEPLLTVPASTRGGDCVSVGDAAAVNSSDCTPSDETLSPGD